MGKRGVKEMKNQTMYISMLLWLHTYFSLNSVFIVCSIYIQGGPNIVFDMKMRNVLMQEVNAKFKSPVDLLQSVSTRKVIYFLENAVCGPTKRRVH